MTQKILELLPILIFDTDLSLVNIITQTLFIAGLWQIFRKCGVKPWWSLVPLFKFYKLSTCADREPEGRTLFVVEAISDVCLITTYFVDPDSNFALFLAIFSLLNAMVVFIYTVRVYLGLIEVFGRKRGWIILWMVIPSVPATLWGWLKEFQPGWTVSQADTTAADTVSGTRAVVMDQGLTVNLEDRTVTEMLQRKVLLKDIHMYIKPGHMVLLLGGSGAGKTTFLNAVNGYEKAHAEVTLNGRNMYKNYKEMQYDIGFVPQQDLMRGSDSVFRTLMDAASLRLPKNMFRDKRKERVEEVMGVFGLTPVRNNLVTKLSGGQRKRLSIAMEFISNPSLFILDEPDSGLDGVMARELFQQLRAIADQGRIIIVITHTPDRVIDLFDDVIVLAKDAKRTGRLAFFGPIGEAREFFGKHSMEEIVKCVNRQEEGGEGRADEFILKYTEVQHG